MPTVLSHHRDNGDSSGSAFGSAAASVTSCLFCCSYLNSVECPPFLCAALALWRSRRVLTPPLAANHQLDPTPPKWSEVSDHRPARSLRRCYRPVLTSRRRSARHVDAS